MPIQMPSVSYDLVRLTGGMDLITPTLSLPPGFTRNSINFEANQQGGYTRVQGYERMDGRASPSDATFGIVQVTGLGTIPVGSTITGSVSAVTAVVIYVGGGMVAFTKSTGTFQVGENLLVAAVPQGAVSALGPSTTSSQFSAQIRNLAADAYRSDITAVPGSGPVRGVVYLNGRVYAFRNNAGGTALGVYRSSPTGWVAVPLGSRIAFSAGAVQPVEGQTINGQTSGATAIVRRVATRTGAWSGTATGFFIVDTVTGTFQSGENIRVGAVVQAVAASTMQAITLLPGGRLEFDQFNFAGSNGQRRMRAYGADGVNPGFEFDGTTLAPILTGMPVDAPTHVAVHKNHVFFSFGPSVQHSGVNAPFTWTAVAGAAELLVKGDVTNFQVQAGAQDTGAMLITSRNSTSVLYGTSSADWNLVTYEDTTGALAYTTQNIGKTYMLDDRGVLSLANTLAYGNFDSASITQQIQPWLEQRQSSVLASTCSRRKTQYRLYFGDGSALHMTFKAGKLVGAMPQQFPHIFNVACEGEDGTGLQVIYVGATNGFVYQLDAGTSFDGEDIGASMPLVFNSIRSPRIRKRYRKAALEVTGSGYGEFSFSYQLGYNVSTIAQPGTVDHALPLTATFWDEFVWDQFVWDGVNLAPEECELDGTAENISVIVASVGDYFESFTINSIVLHYTPRRGMR